MLWLLDKGPAFKKEIAVVVNGSDASGVCKQFLDNCYRPFFEQNHVGIVLFGGDGLDVIVCFRAIALYDESGGPLRAILAAYFAGLQRWQTVQIRDCVVFVDALL